MTHNSYMANLVRKYNAHWELRNTPEGDALLDELYDECGAEFLELFYAYMDAGDNGIIDVSQYLRNSTRLDSSFFEYFNRMGRNKFKLDTKVAFYGKADYFFAVLRDPRVYLLDAEEKNDPTYAIFKIVT